MKTLMILAAAAVATPAPKPFPAPSEIVTAAPAGDWVAIAASDLLVMDLANDANAKPRRVVIQLMPPPFSQGWVGNIRKLAAARWWDGTGINRVQDNYVVQWGDASEKKVLPGGLITVLADKYLTKNSASVSTGIAFEKAARSLVRGPMRGELRSENFLSDRYADYNIFSVGWPLGADEQTAWPVHCYGMVGVGRDMPPNTGTGAELYTVIGHAPRHLDRKDRKSVV